MGNSPAVFFINLKGEDMAECSVIIGGKKVYLPTLTLDLAERQDEVRAAKGARERYELQLAYLKDVVAEEQLEEALGSLDIEECDLVELNVSYIKVVNAYSAPVLEAQAKAANEQVKAVRPALDVIAQAKN